MSRAHLIGDWVPVQYEVSQFTTSFQSIADSVWGVKWGSVVLGADPHNDLIFFHEKGFWVMAVDDLLMALLERMGCRACRRHPPGPRRVAGRDAKTREVKWYSSLFFPTSSGSCDLHLATTCPFSVSHKKFFVYFLVIRRSR